MNFVIKPYENWNLKISQNIEAPDIFKACEEYAEINKFTGILFVLVPTLEVKAVTIYYEYPKYIALRNLRTIPREILDVLESKT